MNKYTQNSEQEFDRTKSLKNLIEEIIVLLSDETQLFVRIICGVNHVQIKLEVDRKHKASILQELKYIINTSIFRLFIVFALSTNISEYL